jgi:hypothetical protein
MQFYANLFVIPWINPNVIPENSKTDHAVIPTVISPRNLHWILTFRQLFIVFVRETNAVETSKFN